VFGKGEGRMGLHFSSEPNGANGIACTGRREAVFIGKTRILSR
jgi:hypothetical protein